MKSVSLIIAILVIVAIAALVIWILQFVYLLMGWAKIKNGGLNRKIKTTEIAEADEDDFEAVEDGFEQKQDFAQFDESVDSGSQEEDTRGDNKNWLLWGGIGAAVVALFLVVWFVWLNPSDKNEDLRYVYTQSMGIYGTPSEHADEVARLDFGKQVTILDNVDGGEWVKVEYLGDDGVLKQGYAPLTELSTFGDFEAFKQAGFNHEYVQQAIQSAGQRKAVMDYFTQNVADSIKTISPSFEGVCALAALCDDVETLAFIVGNKHSSDKLVVYTIDEKEHPHLYSQKVMPEDAEAIQSISGSNGNINVTFTPARDRTMSFEVEENISESPIENEEPGGDEYTKVYKGTINGKYAIEMTLSTDGGAYYTGEYFYTKNKTPIQLRGQLTDDYEHLVLEEFVGMNMTGKFEGTLSPNSYTGTWTSADGKTSYPFTVSKIH